MIEVIIPDDSSPSWTKLMDILMLAWATGRERTESEFRQMLRAAGFRLDRTIDIGMKTSILESVTV